ncbi:MAG: hypothetical protein J2P41_06625 [Blastocatellia bacterium]|nr:hypothetical protein [Blastocatellia bacterium]
MKSLPQWGRSREKQLRKHLDALVKDGRVRSQGNARKVYWLPDLEEKAAARVIEALGNSPLTLKKLESTFKNVLVGWPVAKRKELLRRLEKEKRIYKVPAVKGTGILLSAQPAQPVEYLQKPIQKLAGEIRKLQKRLEKAGVTADQFFASAHALWRQALPAATNETPIPSQADREQLFLDGMKRLNNEAANGALVPLSELRQALFAHFPDRSSFDQVVLKLADEGRVVLHRHVFPGSLNREERESLVADDRGNLFVGVAFRV